MAVKRTLGDAPIEQAYIEKMNHLANYLDTIFNGDKRGMDRETGFVLLVFPFGEGEGQRANYISNADREDVVTLLKEQVKRFSEQASDDRWARKE